MKSKHHNIIIFIILLIPTLTHSWPIPHSGQTKCYDNEKEIPCPKPGEPFYGQSGNYIINPRSYTKLDEKGNDLPDDAEEWFMVRDNVTGLIWEVKQAKDGVKDYSNPNDADNKYTWYDTNPETNEGYTGTYNDGQNTETFITQLNKKCFGDARDWRLPTITELASIKTLSSHNPAMDIKYFKGKISFYWSSTLNDFYKERMWGVNFSHGNTDYKTKSSSFYVRAVRGEKCRKFERFVINDDRTVTDTYTGLMWSPEISETRKTWKEALEFCEIYNYTGNNDWRLPEIRELLSIVDYSKYGPAIDTNFFSTMYGYYFTRSTFDDFYPDRVWSVDFNYGFVSETAKSSYYVRAVRGGQCWLSDHLIILLPKQAAILITGTTIPITWQSTGIEGKVKIFLSRFGGKEETFEIITPETENDGHYEWTIGGEPSPNCMLRIEPVSNPYSGTQQSFFTIKNPDILINTNTNATYTISGPETYTGSNKSMIIDNTLPGEYTITYHPVECWQTPASESQMLTYWGTLSFDNSYIPISPEPVQNLRANQPIETWTGNNQITAQWEPIDHCLKGYAFVWDHSSNTEPSDTVTGTDHKTLSPKLNNGDNHWFHIKAINIHGISSKTVHIGPFYIDTSLIPPAPENLEVQEQTNNEIQLKWTPIPDTSTSYLIYRSQSEQGLFYPIHSSPVDYYDVINGYKDTTIEANTTYYYKIKSCRDNIESLNFSNTVTITTDDNNSSFDVMFISQGHQISKSHQIVHKGGKVIFDLVLTKTQDFQGYLDIWCENLPKHTRYDLSINKQTVEKRLEEISDLPITVSLTLYSGSAILEGDYQFNLQCLNTRTDISFQRKSWPIHFTVVPLTGGMFVDISPHHIHKNEQANVFGCIYPPLKDQSIILEAWTNNEKHASFHLKTETGGCFSTHEWVDLFDPGIYTISANGFDPNSVPFSATSRSLIVEKIQPELRLKFQENQIPKTDQEFTIQGQIDPPYESVPVKLSVISPDNTPSSPIDLYTDSNGTFYISNVFFHQKGKYSFIAYYMGDDRSIGCESKSYDVMVGNTGFAIIVGGGKSSQNIFWNTTQKFVSNVYKNFKFMGFTDEMLYLMINSPKLDITDDDIPEDIVDETTPSVNKLKHVIKNQFRDLLTAEETLYVYMQGHGTDLARFKVLGSDEYISSVELNNALTDLQDATQCKVVVILEFCYSGAFIPDLSHDKRVIITSAGREDYVTETSSQFTLSGLLFEALYHGESILDAFKNARKVLIKKNIQPLCLMIMLMAQPIRKMDKSQKISFPF
ncbi:MAG: hypothetical protein OMM_02932 [Candidatus Magnetoglobus multicellularis str. Araruama]|uniref:Fibronectin type-III domain-containing protein n=1 Tax=Candidatus Magnetoglobus multicellularis str. Araruama TaxID=890399 RepID=A0A1V1P7N0_9BACT|nr:MAG: hypothetical protein OMM_02932 [Candidatus Magnetoglobus multicellularis str. Araruama]